MAFCTILFLYVFFFLFIFLAPTTFHSSTQKGNNQIWDLAYFFRYSFRTRVHLTCRQYHIPVSLSAVNHFVFFRTENLCFFEHLQVQNCCTALNDHTMPWACTAQYSTTELGTGIQLQNTCKMLHCSLSRT